MFTNRIDDKTLPMISEFGDRIASDVDKLENLIWLVKAEAHRQLGEAARRYIDAQENNRTTPELVVELHDASARLMTLDKFWSQEVAMRNRAVHFGDLKGRKVAGWRALEEVVKRFAAESPKVE